MELVAKRPKKTHPWPSLYPVRSRWTPRSSVRSICSVSYQAASRSRLSKDGLMSHADHDSSLRQRMGICIRAP
jgi:hypothetical protein